MKDSENSSRALRCPPVAEFSKGQKSKPSKVDGKSRPFPDVEQSKNCLAWYVALNSKTPKEKTACIPQVKWKCPPKFNLNPCWHVVAGEGSKEAKAQMHNASTVLEVVYSHHTSNTVPPSPSSPTHIKDEHCNDRQIPIIPIIPVEEEMSLDTSVPASSINSQLPASSTCPSGFQNLPLSQWDAAGPQGGLINNKSLPGNLHGLEGSDLLVAVAAATTVAAIMESKEHIDTELLMKILSNPEMVKNLIDENKSSCKHGEQGTPASAAETAASVEQNKEPKLGIECSAQLSRSIPANTNTYTRPNHSISLPCTKVEPAGRIQARNVAMPTPTVTSKLGEHSYIYQTSVAKPVRHVVMPSTLRPDEGIMKRWNSQCGPPDTSITKQQESLDPPISSKPRTMEEIKQMIHKYGTVDAGKNLMSPPLVVARPTTIHGHSNARMEGMAAKIPSEVGIIDRDHNHYHNQHHQWGPRHSSFCASSTQLKAAMPLVMPPRMESQPSLPASPGISPFATPPQPPPAPPFSPLTTNFGHLLELNYNSSSPHGQKDETLHSQEHKLLRLLGQPGNILLGQPMLGHKTTPIEINSKYQRPCKYFNNSMGFRNGSEYPSGHRRETSMQQRTGGLEKVAAAATKRMKFTK